MVKDAKDEKFEEIFVCITYVFGVRFPSLRVSVSILSVFNITYESQYSYPASTNLKISAFELDPL